jgi:hypothetical protein
MNSERVFPHCWSALGALSLLLWLTPAGALADRVVNSNEPIVISNDITNRTTNVRSFESDADDALAEPEGQGNHGHGNNEDGVDSSNPGQGGGGPNGDVDESCDGTGECIDDESSGGGASPSNGKGNAGGKKK